MKRLKGLSVVEASQPSLGVSKRTLVCFDVAVL
jgi:hypothetical protein